MAQQVAILEPNTRDRRHLEEILRRGGYTPFHPDLTIDRLEYQLSLAVQFEMLAPLADTSLILLENHYPNLDGSTLIRFFKENKYTVHIPIIVITRDQRYESVLTCVQAGAADYLVKPIDEQLLLRRIAMVLGRNGGALLGQGVESVVLNFQDFLVNELKRAERSDLAMSIILGRMGTAEEINKSVQALEKARGEQIDLRLQKFGQFITGARGKIRQFDTIFRYGPQGLVVVLPMTPRDGAGIVQERLGAIFEEEVITEDALELRQLDLYTGVSSFPEDATGRHDLLLRAEQNLTSHRNLRLGVQVRVRVGKNQQVFWKNMFCPVCRSEFQVEKTRDRTFRLKEQESDFRLIYEKGNPLYYAVPVCPKCYYAAFFADYEQVSETEVAKLKKARLARKRLVRDVDFEASRVLESATISYRLAADCYAKRKTPPSTFARLYHRTAWLFREAGDEEAEREMLQKAVVHYEKSFLREDLKGKLLTDLEVAYLIGELSLRLGQPKRALDYFGNVIRSPKKKEKKRLIEQARDRWYEAKETLKQKELKKTSSRSS